MVFGVKAELVARNNYTFTFTNAQPGSDVGFSAKVYPDASSTVEDGPMLVLDSSNAVSVWSDATILTAHTVDGTGNTLVATATVSSLSVTADSGTAGQSPFGGGGGGGGASEPLLVVYPTEASATFPFEVFVPTVPLTAWGDTVIDREVTVTSVSGSSSTLSLEVDVVSGDFPAIGDVQVTITPVRDASGAVITAGTAYTAHSTVPVPTGDAVTWDTFHADTSAVARTSDTEIKLLNVGTYRVVITITAP